MAKRSKARWGWLWLVGIVWDIALVCLAYVAVVGLLALAGKLGERAEMWMFSLWVLAGVGGFMFMWGLGLVGILALVRLKRIEQSSAAAAAVAQKTLACETAQEAILTNISENLLISDAIKSVAFRQKDRQVIVDAIRQDMRAEQWESAELLIDDMERRLGCRQRAGELRDEMEHLKNSTRHEKIEAAVKDIHSLWMIHRYEEALQEADVLNRLYPEEERVHDLGEATEKHRQGHKQQLLKRLDKAVQNEDAEQGVELLKLLDAFLTPTEGAALKESARGVFRAKLQQMGVKFSLFVTEKKWDKALRLGQEIMSEFPNSRMAEEVREKLPVLERRAADG